MKSFESDLKEFLLRGLRKNKNAPRNQPDFIECHNLSPKERGIEVHEEITFIGY